MASEPEHIFRNTTKALFQTAFQNLERTVQAAQEQVDFLAAALESKAEGLSSRTAHDSEPAPGTPLCISDPFELV